ncbi:MAG: hypothetical protein QME79_06880 [Bacillota bacterium]|nr:hypothetical protein [Bacillota bacterium]
MSGDRKVSFADRAVAQEIYAPSWSSDTWGAEAGLTRRLSEKWSVGARLGYQVLQAKNGYEYTYYSGALGGR